MAMTEAEVMQSRAQELERAVADLRQVIGSIVEHLAAGGHVRRGDALFKDLKRIHRHTRDALAKKITGGASRWWTKNLGERVVMLEAELERHRFRAVMVDKALEVGKVLEALSDEAIAAEYDKRMQRFVSTRTLEEFADRAEQLAAFSDEALFAELEGRGYDNPFAVRGPVPSGP